MMQKWILHHPSFLIFFVQLLFDLLDPQKSTKTYIGSIRSAYFLHKLCLECWNFDRKKYVNLPPWELPGIHLISCRYSSKHARNSCNPSKRSKLRAGRNELLIDHVECKMKIGIRGFTLKNETMGFTLIMVRNSQNMLRYHPWYLLCIIFGRNH